MAKLIQSLEARFINPTPQSGVAGTAVSKRYSVSLPAGLEVGDKLEIGCIQSGCRVTDVVIDADNGLGITAKVGVMTGNYGDEDSTRTVGGEFFESLDLAATGGVHRPIKTSAYRTTNTDYARGVGIEVLALATLGSGEIGITLTVVA